MSNVRRFGAAGDGKTDDTEAIRHAAQDGDGMLHFPPGSYRVTKPIVVALARSGPLGIDGTGGTARVLMAGPGPAFRLVGTHGGTGDPSSVKGNVFPNQRMPTIKNIEIEGAHPEADGIQLIQTMQSVFEGVLVHRCRHGIHLTQRNRNVLISHCHVYYNTGVGIFFDHVDLHQINIASCHISYNRLGGIRIEGSAIHNLQVTGNDIEYNNDSQHGTEAVPTAEIYVDTTKPGSKVSEITIASNTIQATASPGGCNIRIRGTTGDSAPTTGLWAIASNIIGSQENNVHLTNCRGVSLSGNCIYSCGSRNLLIEDSSQINIGTNTFRRHTPRSGTGVRIVRSSDVTVTGCSIQDEHPDGQPSNASLLELIACRRVNISGCQFLDGVPCGIDAADSSHVSITGCTIHDTRAQRKSRHAVRFTGEGQGNLVGMNSIGSTTKSTLALGDAAGVTVHGNVVDS